MMVGGSQQKTLDLGFVLLSTCNIIQIICANDLQSPRPLEGFGFSLGLNGADLDENGYPDMAIGAALSSSVAVLRARPVVK
ncbi:unnamed protein product [Schistosoma margrebowiei]|uniref:Uncharacterized protein n=1 Tax=Schistosoma margrebowiei TaxID=48269 RepID=A0A183LT31_9TREM|nr:unnamed protein product [Schistosoma margrebowiei]